MKKIVYSEPKSYFNADMLKAAKEWDEKHAKKETPKKTSTKKGK